MRLNAFQRVLAAEVVSNFGSMLSRLVIPWLAALVLDATPFQMGLFLVADVAAGALASLLLGAMVDRLGKRAVMLAADLARAALLGALAWMALTRLLPFWLLVLAVAGRGLLTVIFELARSAWIARQLPPEQLPGGNAQLAAGSSLAETAAFALGGWLYQGLGALAALLLDAASYLLSALCLRRVPEVAAVAGPAPDRGMRALAAEARAGIAALAAVPALRVLAAVEVLVCLGLSIASTSYLIFVARDLGFATGVLGLIFATGGIGSLAGAALAPRLDRRLGRGALPLGLALLALGALCTPLAPGATPVGAALLVAHQVIADSGHTVYGVQDRTLRQTLAPPALLARVDAGIRTFGQCATLTGALGGGGLATLTGTRPALFLSCGLFAAAALVAYLGLAALHRTEPPRKP
jgi:MFS family permease